MTTQSDSGSANDTSTEVRHSAEDVARGLAAKLGSRARHVCLLLGAGASCAAGLPALAELQTAIVSTFTGDERKRVEELLGRFNLEEMISRLRGLQALLEDGEQLGGLAATDAAALDEKICRAIVASVDSSSAPIDAFARLASWAARMDNQTPIELFTVNYDLLVERGLERLGVPYFDGFVGGVEAPFAPDLVEPRDAPEARAVPTGFVRLWKLHGSTNWRSRVNGGERVTVRVADSDADGAAAIYPSDEKYDEARRVPFVVLMDRFRRALVEPETITLTTGYSFGDDHLNEMLFDAARRHPRSEVVALCFGSIPEKLALEAASTRNLLVVSPDEAIVDGHRAAWGSANDLPGVFEDGKFMLGDFALLAAFLSGHVAQFDE